MNTKIEKFVTYRFVSYPILLLAGSAIKKPSTNLHTVGGHAAYPQYLQPWDQSRYSENLTDQTYLTSLHFAQRNMANSGAAVCSLRQVRQAPESPLLIESGMGIVFHVKPSFASRTSRDLRVVSCNLGMHSSHCGLI
jgi:hypothetical protein